MRVWLSRLRTALAIAAALLMIINIPTACRLITTPEMMPYISVRPTVILRVWYCESWTGGGMQWLLSEVSAFEKAHPQTRVSVRRVPKNEWLVDGIVLPDLLLFETGAMPHPEEWLMRLQKQYPLKEPLKLSGTRHGLLYAVPVCYGGNVRLLNENKTEGIELVMQTEQQYQDFVSEKASALIATVREARRLSALREAGKAFPFLAEPHGEKTEMILFASILGSAGTRTPDALTLLDFLLSEQAQSHLPAAGLLPTLDAVTPDEQKYPLLFAMNAQISQAANAFD